MEVELTGGAPVPADEAQAREVARITAAVRKRRDMETVVKDRSLVFLVKMRE
jgi:hypothetical protein